MNVKRNVYVTKNGAVNVEKVIYKFNLRLKKVNNHLKINNHRQSVFFKIINNLK